MQHAVPATAVNASAVAAPDHAATPSPVTSRRGWVYPAVTGGRDLRIDFLRGVAITFVVVDHIDIDSAFHAISHERIGSVSGAELFVALSGIVLGMVHRRRAIADGWLAAAKRMWSRALLLYLTCLAVMVASWIVSRLPGLDGQVLTTWTDEATNTVYSMYGTTPLLADYPVPPSAVRDIVLLNVGPYQFNVMGLYVVLLAVAPFALRLLLAGRWWTVLLISGAAYALNHVQQVRLFPSQFDSQFPLLSWQLLFFAGLILGFHRDQVMRWFDGPAGRLTALLAFALFAGFLTFAWNNPARANDPFAWRLAFISNERYWEIYDAWFARNFLGPLRVANVTVVLVVAYAVLTRLWRPLHLALGWFFVPLGAATLYVFILHLVFALLVASIPGLDTGSVWQHTAVHAAILLALWLMVRTKFLFRWVPR